MRDLNKYMFAQRMERKRKLHFFDCGLKSLYVVDTVSQRVCEIVPEPNCLRQKAEVIDIVLAYGVFKCYRKGRVGSPVWV